MTTPSSFFCELRTAFAVSVLAFPHLRATAAEVWDCSFDGVNDYVRLVLHRTLRRRRR